MNSPFLYPDECVWCSEYDDLTEMLGSERFVALDDDGDLMAYASDDVI